MIFVFSKPWEHAGRQYAPGDAAELTDSECRKLACLGAGKPDIPPAQHKQKRRK